MLAVVTLQQFSATMTPAALDRLEPFLRQSHTGAFVDGYCWSSGESCASLVADIDGEKLREYSRTGGRHTAAEKSEHP